jgi:uncharacterized membrane protein YgdD (TMEM256/DUF423 family)
MERIEKRIIATGAFFCVLAVSFGALGAHALKSIVGPTSVNTWELAAQYQMYHGLAILAVGLIHIHISNRWIKSSFLFMCLGIILFSGSLYLLALKSILSQGFISIIGPITPIGGILFIIGWILLIIGILKK